MVLLAHEHTYTLTQEDFFTIVVGFYIHMCMCAHCLYVCRCDLYACVLKYIVHKPKFFLCYIWVSRRELKSFRLFHICMYVWVCVYVCVLMYIDLSLFSFSSFKFLISETVDRPQSLASLVYSPLVHIHKLKLNKNVFMCVCTCASSDSAVMMQTSIFMLHTLRRLLYLIAFKNHIYNTYMNNIYVYVNFYYVNILEWVTDQ